MGSFRIMRKMKFFTQAVAALFVLIAAVVPAAAQLSSAQTYVASTGGSANAQTITVPNVGSMADLLGVTIRIKPSFTNTSAMTLNPNGLGNQPVNKTSASGPIALVGSEFVASPNAQTVEVMWDGARFLILSDVNSSPTGVFPFPQGYLTPCPAAGGVTGCTAGNIIPTGDVTSVGTLYYTPAFGNQIPIYNGAAMVTYQFSELTLTLGSSNLANTLYDVCVTTTSAGAYSINGTPTVVTSVAWTTSTAGAGARGTGASTAQIARVNGIETNAVQIDGKNGATTYTSIPANRCTIVGTIYIDGTNGQVTFHRTYGQSRKWSAWNFYNRLPVYLKAGDNTSSWTYNGVSYRPSNNNSANNFTVVTGLAEEPLQISNTQTALQAASNDIFVGIGINSTSVASGSRANFRAGSSAIHMTTTSFYQSPPLLGVNVVTSLEKTSGATGTFDGTEENFLLSGWWRG